MSKTNGKIKILQVCAIDETLKSLLLPLVNKLIEEGFDVTACCSNGKNSEELRKKGYNIKNIEIARSINPISNIKSIIKLVGLMRAKRYDIVHVHTPVAAVLGRVAAKLAKVPIIIYTAHGFYFHERMSKLTYKFVLGIEKFAGRFLSDFIFTQSEEDRKTAIKEHIINEDRICTIGNGVDIAKFDIGNLELSVLERVKGELKINGEDKIITYLGRMVREKGIFELLEAFNGIKSDNYKLLLVGDRFTAERDNSTYNELKMLVESNENIIMTGRRTDINYLLALSNVFVLPSYREGMPRSIIEAMAMGKPVIATNIRGCREEVVEGETGFLVEVGNPKQLKERIIEILETPGMETRMGKKARQRAEEHFDENKVLNREIEIINKLIKEID